MPAFVWLTGKMAQYIVQEGQRLVDIGFGDDDNGILNEISQDTEAYRYTSAVIGFLRMIVGVVRYNYYDAENMDPLLNLFDSEDEIEI